jgi:hypothetical protein
MHRPLSLPIYIEQAQVFRYTNDEYDQLIRGDSAASGWSREDSDHLLDLCDRYVCVICNHHRTP